MEHMLYEGRRTGCVVYIEVGIFAIQAYDGKSIDIYGGPYWSPSPNFPRDAQHAQDIAEALERCAGETREYSKIKEMGGTGWTLTVRQED